MSHQYVLDGLYSNVAVILRIRVYFMRYLVCLVCLIKRNKTRRQYTKTRTDDEKKLLETDTYGSYNTPSSKHKMVASSYANT